MSKRQYMVLIIVLCITANPIYGVSNQQPYNFLTDSWNVELLGIYSFPGFASAVHVVNGYAYVIDEAAGLRIADVSEPANPRELGFYRVKGQGFGVYVSKGYAYVTDQETLYIIDISDPTEPYMVGLCDTPGNEYGVSVVGNYAYVTGGTNGGLKVIDISNPENPHQVGHYQTVGNAHRVYIAGHYAYLCIIASSQALRVIDISKPDNLKEVGFYYTTCSDAYISGNYAYVAVNKGLQIIDISDPMNLDEVGFRQTPDAAIEVHVSGNCAYVIDNIGLRIMDISDPTNPRNVGFYNTPGNALGIYVANDYVYVADGKNGLLILKYTGGSKQPGEELPDTTVPAVTQLFQNYPNPFSLETRIPYQLSEGSEVAIRIYSVAGDMIQELNQGYKPAGFYIERDRAVYWDGMNEAGEPVASGVYVYVIQAGDFRDMKKMAIER